MATRESILPEQTAEQMRRESNALRGIAMQLGKDDEWDVELLEWIADHINLAANLPHPGDEENTEAYLDESNAAWEAANPDFKAVR